MSHSLAHFGCHAFSFKNGIVRDDLVNQKHTIADKVKKNSACSSCHSPAINDAIQPILLVTMGPIPPDVESTKG